MDENLMNQLDSILDNAIEGIDTDEKLLAEIGETAEAINEAVYDGIIPLHRIAFKVVPHGGWRTGATVSADWSKKDEAYKYMIRLRKLRIDTKGWQDTAGAIEHELKHVKDKEEGKIISDKDKQFVYECGLLNVPAHAGHNVSAKDPQGGI